MTHRIDAPSNLQQVDIFKSNCIKTMEKNELAEIKTTHNHITDVTTATEELSSKLAKFLLEYPQYQVDEDNNTFLES